MGKISIAVTIRSFAPSLFGRSIADHIRDSERQSHVSRHASQ